MVGPCRGYLLAGSSHRHWAEATIEGVQPRPAGASSLRLKPSVVMVGRHRGPATWTASPPGLGEDKVLAVAPPLTDGVTRWL